MATYLFFSIRESRGGESRMILRPISGQRSYRSRSERQKPLLNRRLQMALHDRSAVCQLPEKTVYALWQPGNFSVTTADREGRLLFHSSEDDVSVLKYTSFRLQRNSQREFLLGDGFLLTPVGALRDGYTVADNNNVLATDVIFYDDDRLEEAVHNSPTYAADPVLAELPAEVYSSLPVVLKNSLTNTYNKLVEHYRERGIVIEDDTIHYDQTVAGSPADNAPTVRTVEYSREEKIRLLQTIGLDFSKIVSRQKRTVFELVEKLTLGVVDFDFYKADGSIRHARGTRNTDIISPLTTTEERDYNRDRANGTTGNIEVITYFDVDKLAFRSFSCDRLIGMSLAPVAA